MCVCKREKERKRGERERDSNSSLEGHFYFLKSLSGVLGDERMVLWGMGYTILKLNWTSRLVYWNTSLYKMSLIIFLSVVERAI